MNGCGVVVREKKDKTHFFKTELTKLETIALINYIESFQLFLYTFQITKIVNIICNGLRNAK